MTDKIGYFFLLVSGILYTLERVGNKLADSILKAGFYAGSKTGEEPSILELKIYDNIFIILFLILGVSSIIYHYRKEIKLCITKK